MDIKDLKGKPKKINQLLKWAESLPMKGKKSFIIKFEYYFENLLKSIRAIKVKKNIENRLKVFETEVRKSKTNYILFKLKMYYEDIKNSQDNCELIKYISAKTFYKYGYANFNNINLHEITITESIVFDIWFLSQYYNLKPTIQIFESTEEPINGADLVLNIKIDKDKYKTLMAQCKSLKKGANKNPKNQYRYDELYHAVAKTQRIRSDGSKRNFQIETLIEYCQNAKGSPIPVYLFYNFETDLFNSKIHPDKALFGITIANAHSIKKEFFENNPLRIKRKKAGAKFKKEPEFSIINSNIAKSFSKFICPFTNKNISSLDKENILEQFITLDKNLNVSKIEYQTSQSGENGH